MASQKISIKISRALLHQVREALQQRQALQRIGKATKPTKETDLALKQVDAALKKHKKEHRKKAK